MPGMYAQVKFSLMPADAVWVVPATALIARAAGPQVATVRNDGTVRYVGVQLGRDLGQSLEIVAGLEGRTTRRQPARRAPGWRSCPH